MSDIRQVRASSLALYQDLTSRIHMHMSAYRNKVPVIVEGDTDMNVISALIEDSNIFVAGKRSVVLETARELANLNGGVCICVFDRDYDEVPSSIDGESLYHPYPGRDLESSIIQWGGGETLVRMAVPTDRLRSAGGAGDVVRRVRHQALRVSLLRMLNQANSWGLPFSKVPIGEFISADGSLDLERYLDRLILKRGVSDTCPDLDSDKVKSSLEIAGDATLATVGYRGRDFLQILSKYLSFPWIKAKASIGSSAVSLEFTLLASGRSVVGSTDWGRRLRELAGRSSTEFS